MAAYNVTELLTSEPYVQRIIAAVARRLVVVVRAATDPTTLPLRLRALVSEVTTREGGWREVGLRFARVAIGSAALNAAAAAGTAPDAIPDATYDAAVQDVEKMLLVPPG